MRYGPAPPTVDSVDIARYIGVWHEIASNPVFFNKDLVGVTATYGLRADGKVSVLNRGFAGSLDGKEESIEGVARVVDTETNSKLKVTFFPLLGPLAEGNYWIVALDAEDYQYAVVTDDRQYTLFVLYREPEIPGDLYDAILEELDGIGIDLSRLRVTGAVLE
jgi:lipocalin